MPNLGRQTLDQGSFSFERAETNSKPSPSHSPRLCGRKKRVVVIHGDPNLPNSILPGGKWDEDDFESLDILKKALSKLEDAYEFRFLSDHDSLLADLHKLSKSGEGYDGVDIVLQVRLLVTVAVACLLARLLLIPASYATKDIVTTRGWSFTCAPR
jgi:hypothetical protein